MHTRIVYCHECNALIDTYIDKFRYAYGNPGYQCVACYNADNISTTANEAYKVKLANHYPFCAKCDKPVKPDKRITASDNKVYCASCYQNVISYAVKNTKKSADKNITASIKKDSYNCDHCSLEIEKAPYKIGIKGEPYCSAICFQGAMSGENFPERFDEYQVATRETAIYDDSDINMAAAYLALGIAGEAGELVEHIKKTLRGDTSLAERTDQIVAEAGDLLWYVARLLDTIDRPLSEAAYNNITKLRDRKKRGKIKGDGDER